MASAATPGPRARRHRQRDTTQPIHAMHPRLFEECAEQRPICAAIDGNVRPSQRHQRQRAFGSVRSSPTLPPATVTASTDKLRRSQRQQQRECVIGAGVAVQDDWDRHGKILVSRASRMPPYAAMSMQYFTVPDGDAEPGGDQAVMVPYNSKSLAPNSPERTRRLRKHLVQSLRALRTMKDPVGNASGLHPAPKASLARSRKPHARCAAAIAARAAASTPISTSACMARVRQARPELDARAVMRLYLDRVPATGYDGSCIFHAEHGCTLDRSLRSGVCNVYFCDMLGKFVQNADKATSAIVMSGEGDVGQMSPVLTP